MNLGFSDAHNHLHDERFGGRQAEIMTACSRQGVLRMVVNGSCESDWPQVLALAKRFGRDAVERVPTAIEAGHTRIPQVLPSFGYHPWYVHERTPAWEQRLIRFLEQVPSAVGEIGLDRWKPDLQYEGQEEVFIVQLRLAAERNLPMSIHCLQAWGRMLEILKREPLPACGFLLHSYGGPKEMVKSFAELGAHFSLPGYYAHERKERQREAFKHVPPDRLLIETDAPDQMLPAGQCSVFSIQNPEAGGAQIYSLTDSMTGKPINHPANLRVVYEFAAGLFGESLETLAARVEANFSRLFGRFT